MAIIPKQSTDFKVVRRSDFTMRLTVKDSTSSAVNLTGYTVAGEVYNEDRSTKYADWTVAYTNRANGIVDVSLSDDQTTTFTPKILFYDFKYTQPDGREFVYLRGKLFMLEGYTA
tara:strand:+ start:2088 stop:2432 length:345 start_codon:yes stop_codon:yes gene_type:complete